MLGTPTRLRRGSLAAAVAALVLAGWSPAAAAASSARPPQAAGSLLTAAPSAAFPYAAELDTYLRSRPGVTTVAVRPAGDPTTYTYAPWVTGVTASIVKVDILATVLRRAQDAGRGLSAWEQGRIVPMITQSDNNAASDLWNDLGGGPALARFNALLPLRSTTMGPGGYWGLTTTTAADQVALLSRFAAPNDVLSDGSRAYALDLMHQVRADQAWGVTAGPPPGAVAVKNGWLPRSDGWHVNSDGIVATGGTGYVVSVLTASATASMADQVATIEGVSRIIWRQSSPSAIPARYAALGAAAGPLGPEVTGEQPTPARAGRYAVYRSGSIYWSPGTGAWDVRGLIRDHWGAIGWENGLLGFPTTGENPLAAGAFSRFENGQVYWSPPAGAHEVHGAIFPAWGRTGYENGPLGYPTTDETRTPGDTGAYNHFTGGSVYWSPATGAHEVHGAIRTAWAALGWESSPLGFPVTDETPTPTVVGAYNHFTGGSVYWSPATGAHAVLGPLLAAWSAGGWERGCLGFPSADESVATAGGTTTRTSQFEHGTITYTAAAGAVVHCS